MEKTKNIFKVIGITALIGMVITGIVLGCIFGLNDRNINTPDDNLQQVDHNEQLHFDTVVENGIRLTSSTSENDTRTVTATVLPDTADDLDVSWNVSFNNPSSAWASDKNVEDYISLQVSGVNHETCNIECLQAFGEQIILTCSAVVNSDVSATCYIDYEKRVSFNIGITEATAGTVNAINFSDSALSYSFRFSTSFDGLGTIEPTISSSSCNYKFTDAFRNALDIAYDFNDCTNAIVVTVNSASSHWSSALVMKKWSDYDWVRGVNNGNLGWEVYDFSKLISSSYSSAQKTVFSTVIKKQKDALMSYSGNVLEFECSATTANGLSYTSTEYVGMGTCDFPSMTVSSVSLSDSSVVF